MIRRLQLSSRSVSSAIALAHSKSEYAYLKMKAHNIDKNKILFWISGIQLLSIAVTIAQVESYLIDSDKRDFKVKIGKSLPEFTFSFIFASDANESPIGISRIEIRRGKEKRILQTIMGKEIADSDDQFDNYRFGTEDMNFDGYLDLLLEVGNEGSGGAMYEVWLYDPKSGTFKANQELEELFNPVPDPETKTITSYSWGGVSETSEETFRFENNELIPLREVKKEYDDSLKQFIRTITLYNHKKVSSVTIDTLKEKVE